MINERVDKKVQGYRGVAHATYVLNQDISLGIIWEKFGRNLGRIWEK